MKNILLCVSGITPQIITETLYALSVLRNPPFIPDEIHVITTSVGKKLIIQKLLDPVSGHFHRLIANYRLTAPKFDLETIHVIADDSGDIVDIVDERHNEITAGFIIYKVKELCTPEENRVHASIAGGRKTMSLFLGMGMQFFAKEKDEMSHVLVNPPFEGHPEFFYPPDPPKEITVYNPNIGRYENVSTSEAKITLANIPFIRLNMPNNPGLELDLNFLVDVAQQKIEECIPSIEVSTSDLTIYISSKKVDLTPLERAIYFWMLKQKTSCEENFCPKGCRDCYITVNDIDLNEILYYYKKIVGIYSMRAENFEKSLDRIDIRSWFLQHKSRINNKLRKIDFTSKSIIKSFGIYGEKTYGIDIPKKMIFLNE